MINSYIEHAEYKTQMTHGLKEIYVIENKLTKCIKYTSFRMGTTPVFA